MKMTLFLLMEATPDWLRLSREKRAAIAEPALSNALAGLGATARHFDAEAFHARVSDIAVLEAPSAKEAYFVMERLRDSPLIAEGYFRMTDIIPAFEDGFRQFEASEAP